MGGAREELARVGVDGLRGECPFGGCGKPSRSGREPLCEGHYYQRRRGEDLRPLKPQRRKGEGGECILDGCDRPTKGGMCPMHRARTRRNGDPMVTIEPKDRAFKRGPEHPSWTDEPSYSALHFRLRKNLGSASKRTCAMGCGKSAAQWALVIPRSSARLGRSRGEYLPVGSSIDDYSPLCIPCHKAFDLAWIAVQPPPVPPEG